MSAYEPKPTRVAVTRSETLPLGQYGWTKTELTIDRDVPSLSDEKSTLEAMGALLDEMLQARRVQFMKASDLPKQPSSPGMKVCKYCGGAIYWQNKQGRWIPYNPDQTIHDCRRGQLG